MKKRILIYGIIILVLSGWIAFLIEYMVSGKTIGRLEAKNSKFKAQLKYVNHVSQNLNATISIIDKTIGDLENIKVGLNATKKQLGVVGKQNKSYKSASSAR
ncbi:MAG: hypothetical protein M1501_02050 [Candidatus Omnitrophica bacterium]|nr:hypothetical protein [Candidatus Omnitrophota bacterium]